MVPLHWEIGNCTFLNPPKQQFAKWRPHSCSISILSKNVRYRFLGSVLGPRHQVDPAVCAIRNLLDPGWRVPALRLLENDYNSVLSLQCACDFPGDKMIMWALLGLGRAEILPFPRCKSWITRWTVGLRICETESLCQQQAKPLYHLSSFQKHYVVGLLIIIYVS